MSFEIKPNTESYDVIIVGSGACGRMATKILSEAGLSMMILKEAEGMIDQNFLKIAGSTCSLAVL